MKLVEGGTLAGFRALPKRRHGRSPRLLESINHAHQRGIIHRDLKPGNIRMDRERQPHVADFGLAKRVDGDSKLTRTGAVMGMLPYMPPEQASGKRPKDTRYREVMSSPHPGHGPQGLEVKNRRDKERWTASAGLVRQRLAPNLLRSC